MPCGNLDEVAISPFADPSLSLRIKASNRVLSTVENAILTAGNTDTTQASIDSATAPPKGFKPARAIIFIPSVAGDADSVGTEKTSQITGIKYNPRDGNNFTLPFGQPGTATNLNAVQSAIKSAVNGIDTARSVSFQPEVWR